MRHTLFLSDLHLNEKYPNTTQYFVNFIENHAFQAQAIYILGDFFDVWIGDDEKTDFYQNIKSYLKRVTDQNVPVYFIHGNRDFLIGKKFAKQTGCKILKEFSKIQLYGQNILLLHGDALCTLDKPHMKFRKIIQNSFLRTLFLSLPLKTRRKIGDKLRGASRSHHSITSEENLAVVQESVELFLQHYSVTQMIHGHIHEAGVHQFDFGNQMAERIVLGSWEKEGCFLKWHSNGKREMCFFS